MLWQICPSVRLSRSGIISNAHIVRLFPSSGRGMNLVFFESYQLQGRGHIVSSPLQATQLVDLGYNGTVDWLVGWVD